MSLTIGELCAGVGALGMAVTDVLESEVVWRAQFEPPDKRGRADGNQYAAQILARHWPRTPNHGDITAIDYRTVEPVDIVAAGFPCQDISLAGRRAGMLEGTRSGLWRHVARAIGDLRPALVFLENVRSLTSARADDSHVEPCAWCVGETGGRAPVRALGTVLGDLADLGFDAEWEVVRASDVGAPHRRERVFVLAWAAADAAHDGLQRAGKSRGGGLTCAPPSLLLFVTPTAQLGTNGGSQHPDKRKAGGHGPTLADQVEWLLSCGAGSATRSGAGS